VSESPASETSDLFTPSFLPASSPLPTLTGIGTKKGRRDAKILLLHLNSATHKEKTKLMRWEEGRAKFNTPIPLIHHCTRALCCPEPRGGTGRVKTKLLIELMEASGIELCWEREGLLIQ